LAGEYLAAIQLQPRQESVVPNPLAVGEMPSSGGRLVADQQRGVAVRLDDAEANARLGTSVLAGRYQGYRELCGDPASRLRQPQSGLPDFVVADDHVQDPVVVKVEQAHAVVLAVGGAQRLAAQQVLVEPLLRLTERQELDLFPVLGHRMIDEVNDLL